MVGGSSLSRTADRAHPDGSPGIPNLQALGKRPLEEEDVHGGRTRMRTYDPLAP